MEMNEALETLQVQKVVMANMAKQLEILEQSIQDHTLAKETLSGLESKSNGSEALIPIGGGTKAFMTLDNVKQFLIHIGSGVEMEVPIEKAIEHHTSILEKLTGERSKIGEKMKELEHQAASLSMAVEQAYARQMQGAHQSHSHDHPMS